MNKGLEMVAYATNELVSSSEISKKFGSFLSKVSNHTVDKIGVLKNNKVKAVLVEVGEYERMQIALEIIEDNLIYDEIKDRLEEDESKHISFEEMAKKHNINVDEL